MKNNHKNANIKMQKCSDGWLKLYSDTLVKVYANDSYTQQETANS